MSAPRVVVVARDAVLRAALEMLLARHGVAVVDGGGGLDGAFRVDARHEVTAVLVDARALAEVGVPAAVRALRALSRDVVVMAGRPDHPVLVEAVEAGALALTARFDEDALVDLLRGGGGQGEAGVREPRRPRPPDGTLAAAAAPPGGA